jgi:ABC-type transport system involved in cytochrome bd biosynthesis fused ATPase/permease subunit
VALIERFYDPQAGSISLDGTDIKDINLHSLRSLIGYVGQEPALFGTTIKGNIKYGKPDATQEEIEAAAKMANAHDFISLFPEGYDTQVRFRDFQGRFLLFPVMSRWPTDSFFALLSSTTKQVGDKGAQLSGGKQIFSVHAAMDVCS